ncbi:unnamed protein product [Xylocopa violacea]|uniref:DNA primase large subunit n=1 Tax=Xylocopa violacea TaxID=135666 RepID=A0ABP1NUU3_XYLVO
MEYTKKRRVVANVESDLHDIYPHDLQIYEFPPRGEMTLEEFKQLGMERLKTLQYIESSGVRTDIKTVEERKQYLSTTLAKEGLKFFAHLLYGKGCKTTDTELQYRRKDHISHFILRLSYCRDPDRQAWFIQQETDLFKLRFSSLDKEGIEKLLTICKIDCQQITHEEKEKMREELHVSTAKITNIDTTDFYQVPFQKVTDLVRLRKVYVSEGIAYVPQADLVSLFVSYFRKHLNEAMPQARWCLANISEDERLITYFNSIHRTISETAQVIWTTETTPVDKLDELSRTSYPLCMRTLHEALRTHHHLRNSGRIQYGLFIKGIGVTLEDALHFWRSEFGKKLDMDKFDKQYAYSIRHTYGKEGKQTNYTPLGCLKIMSSAVGPGEYHGCPFKHMDNATLKQKLFGYGIPATGINDIAELAKEGNYLIACTKYFEILHNRLPDKAIVHPNGYFIESRAILTKDHPTETESKDKLSQSGRLADRVGTPNRTDRNTSTPSRSTATSLRNTATPPRNADTVSTPLRKTIRETASATPIRSVKATPKRIDSDLTANDIAKLVNDEDTWEDM